MLSDAIVPFATDATGVRLAIRLTPRASRDGLDGVSLDADGRAVLRVRLAAPPVDGAANKALMGFLARALGVAKSSITIRSGETSRLKMLHVAGDPTGVTSRLETLIAGVTLR